MSAAAGETFGTLAEALAQANRLLRTDPALAEMQAVEICKAAPEHPAGHLTLGLARAGMGRHEEAALALRRATELAPNSPEAWRALADQLSHLDDPAGADRAYAQSIRASVNDRRLMEAALALCDGRLAVAEQALRAHLYNNPTDIAAIRMLAEVGARLGRYGDAEKLLSRALELSPSFTAARHNYALVLFRQGKAMDALREIETLLKDEPDNAVYRNLKAAALARIGDYGASIAQFEDVLRDQDKEPRLWLSYGHALKTAGRTADAVAAYRKAAALDPQFGDAYWSLANLKTFRFDAQEIERMKAMLVREDLKEDDRFHLHFALGKALEDASAYADSFLHYEEGARRRRALLDYDPADITEQVRRAKQVFSADFMASRQGGEMAQDPIFIVGLPRSGSTLLEQILSSHSQVEGTMELPDIAAIARELGEKKLKSEVSKYPEALANLTPDQLASLGKTYLDRTRVQRRSGRPLFIDKMPNNWLHVGLIALILPNAKIIDARRNPMATCFSAFKQHFARGQAFTYDLTEIGTYYSDYVSLMAHFDEVAPGRVHRVFYERLVADTESEVRRTLDYCGLEFEHACLEFYDTQRPVRTASSEQVRQPIFRDGLDQWRNYEPWLGPLKQALGAAGAKYAES